jgi:hypothetical protein
MTYLRVQFARDRSSPNHPTAGFRVKDCPPQRTGTAPISAWQFRTAPCPQTVPGTYAGSVSCHPRRRSAPYPSVRGRRGRVGAAVHLRGMPRPGAVSQLLRPRSDLLRRRLRRTRAAAKPTGGRRALPGSRRGQRAHAERAQRYQARPEKLPHHGSLAPVPDDCLPPGSRTVVCGVTNLG